MEQENKELLLKDLCGRLPYGVRVIIEYKQQGVPGREEGIFDGYVYEEIKTDLDIITCIKPYLRPMSSMTEDEKEEYNSHITGIQSGIDAANLMIWIYQHHLDVFHLIEKGLALEAPENMYENY